MQTSMAGLTREQQQIIVSASHAMRDKLVTLAHALNSEREALERAYANALTSPGLTNQQGVELVKSLGQYGSIHDNGPPAIGD